MSGAKRVAARPGAEMLFRCPDSVRCRKPHPVSFGAFEHVKFDKALHLVQMGFAAKPEGLESLDILQRHSKAVHGDVHRHGLLVDWNKAPRRPCDHSRSAPVTPSCAEIAGWVTVYPNFARKSKSVLVICAADAWWWVHGKKTEVTGRSDRAGSIASNCFARGLRHMLVQILLDGCDQLFLAQHLHNCTHLTCTALPQGLDKPRHLPLFRDQPDPAACAALGTESKGRAPVVFLGAPIRGQPSGMDCTGPSDRIL